MLSLRRSGSNTTPHMNALILENRGRKMQALVPRVRWIRDLG